MNVVWAGPQAPQTGAGRLRHRGPEPGTARHRRERRVRGSEHLRQPGRRQTSTLRHLLDSAWLTGRVDHRRPVPLYMHTSPGAVQDLVGSRGDLPAVRHVGCLPKDRLSTSKSTSSAPRWCTASTRTEPITGSVRRDVQRVPSLRAAVPAMREPQGLGIGGSIRLRLKPAAQRKGERDLGSRRIGWGQRQLGRYVRRVAVQTQIGEFTDSSKCDQSGGRESPCGSTECRNAGRPGRSPTVGVGGPPARNLGGPTPHAGAGVPLAGAAARRPWVRAHGSSCQGLGQLFRFGHGEPVAHEILASWRRPSTA